MVDLSAFKIQLHYALYTTQIDSTHARIQKVSVRGGMGWGRLPSSKVDLATFEPWHEISNNVVCGASKGSDHPVHTRSLIRALASRWIFHER